MKKTTTINLNSIVYNIDEDACCRLGDYLDDLRSRLDNDLADEVMEDIEARVGELFSKNLNQYKTVVEVADVESAIKTLGDPESFGPASHAEEKTFGDEPSQAGSKKRRKFYRDGENKILGGIAAGTAVALNWDVTLVRVLFFVCLLASFGWAMLVYILLWCIVPEARTVAQKLEMQGIEPSAQNISDYSQRYQQDDSYCSRPCNSQSAFGTILKVVGALILIPILFVFILVAVVVVASLIWCLGMGMVVAFPGISTFFLVALSVSGILSIIIPLVYLVWLIAKKLMKEDTHIKKNVFATWLFVWLLSLVTASGLTMYAATHMGREDIKNLFEANGGNHKGFGIYVDDDDDDDMMCEVRCDSIPFHTINVDGGAVDMDMVCDSVWFVEVKTKGDRLRNVETLVTDDGELTIRFVNQKNHTAHAVIHYAAPIKVLNFKNGTAAEVNGMAVEDTLFVNCKNGTALEMSDCKVGTLFLDARNGSAVEIDGEAGNAFIVAKHGAAVDIHNLNVVGNVAKEVDMSSNLQK